MTKQNKTQRKENNEESKKQKRKKLGFFRKINPINFNFTKEDLSHIEDQLFERNY